MESRFDYDLGRVRVHTDSTAGQSARAVRSYAYTVGRHIVFGAGQYNPQTRAGRGLLAHELAHVVQQTAPPARAGEDGSSGVPVASRAGSPTLQRRVYEGHDHGGRYEIDDQRCTFEYHQNWFFTFRTSQTPSQRTQYMAAAKRQIEDVWSGQFPLIPANADCSCHPGGIAVRVVAHTHERDRQGRGFTVIVTPSEARGFTNQPLRRIDLGTAHERPVATGVPGGQQRVAHEFGHTIGLTDEYHGWASLFNTAGSQDEPSIMNVGDAVRPRHYQHFADMVNLEIGAGCDYRPNGVRLPEHENPVNRFSGLPIPLLPQNVDFAIGLQYDRRVSNEALLGLIYPTVGAMSIWNPETRSVQTGPTVGLRLNQIAHPLYVDVRTGVLFDPQRPESVLDLNVPLSADLGVRGRGFQVGVNYTAIADILGEGPWTHLVGVGARIDLP